MQLARVQENLTKAELKSPAEGVIVLAQNRSGRGVQEREFQPGDQVWDGRTVATVSDLSKMRVEIELDQEQARRVKSKQRAIITVDALPSESFEGEVTEISQLASESRVPGTGIPSGRRTFQAKVAIKDLKKARLLPGMTAQVRIIMEVIEEAVSVPLECVFEDDERFIVYLRRGKEFREVEVELGEESQDRVVIVKGLKGGDEVALREVAAAGGPSSAGMREAPATPVTPKGAVK